MAEFYSLLEHQLIFKLDKPIASFALSPDGNFLVTGGRYDRTIKVWNLKTGQMLRSWLTASLSPFPSKNIIDSLAISPDGVTLVTGGSLLKAWVFETGKQVRVFKGSTNYTGYITISSDNSTLITENAGHIEGTINVWDLKRGKKIRGQIGGSTVRWVISPDSKVVVGSDRSDKAVLKVWDVRTGTELRTLDNRHAIRVEQLTFSSDGKLLVGGGIDGIKIWDFETGEQVQRVEKYKNVLFHKHLDCIRSLVFSPDNKSVLSSGEDGLIQAWDVSTGKNIGTIQGHIFWMTMSKNARTLIGLGRYQTVEVWKIP